MRSRKKPRKVFQCQPRTTIPPETLPDEVYDGYKYQYNQFVINPNENLPTTPRGSLRSEYI